MIKHYVFKNDKGNMCVKAVMNNCKDDAVRYLKKALPYTEGLPFDVAKMPDSFERVVECDPRDKFNAAEGMRKADERVLAGYNTSRNKALERFKREVNRFCLRDTLDAIDNFKFADAVVRDEKATGDWYERKAAELLGNQD